MAMIKCQECGNEISDKAKTCIHCGYPISLETRKKVKKKEWNELTTEEKQSIMAYRKKIGQSPVVSAIIIALAFLLFTLLIFADMDSILSIIIYLIVLLIVGIITASKNKDWYYKHIDELYEKGIIK